MDCSMPGFPVVPISRVCSSSCPLSQWCYLTISFCVSPFSSCSQSFPASGSFPLSQLFESGGQSIGASVSASVLPMSIQGWFPLGLTGLISLQSKGLSKSFPGTPIVLFFSQTLSPLICSGLILSLYNGVVYRYHWLYVVSVEAEPNPRLHGAMGDGGLSRLMAQLAYSTGLSENRHIKTKAHLPAVSELSVSSLGWVQPQLFLLQVPIFLGLLKGDHGESGWLRMNCLWRQFSELEDMQRTLWAGWEALCPMTSLYSLSLLSASLSLLSTSCVSQGTSQW